MIQDVEAGNSSAAAASGTAEPRNGGNGSGNGYEWIPLQGAAHLAGVTERAVRKWAARGTHGVIGRKDQHTGAWEVRRDSVPAHARDFRPGRPSGSRNEPGTAELIRTLADTQKQALELAARNGWLESETARAREIETRLLPAARTEAEAARDELAGIRRRDRRLAVELVALLVVGVAAALI